MSDVCNYPDCDGNLIKGCCHEFCETIIRNCTMVASFDENREPVSLDERDKRFYELMLQQRSGDAPKTTSKFDGDEITYTAVASDVSETPQMFIYIGKEPKKP